MTREIMISVDALLLLLFALPRSDMHTESSSNVASACAVNQAVGRLADQYDKNHREEPRNTTTKTKNNKNTQTRTRQGQKQEKNKHAKAKKQNCAQSELPGQNLQSSKNRIPSYNVAAFPSSKTKVPTSSFGADCQPGSKAEGATSVDPECFLIPTTRSNHSCHKILLYTEALHMPEVVKCSLQITSLSWYVVPGSTTADLQPQATARLEIVRPAQAAARYGEPIQTTNFKYEAFIHTL